MSWREDPATDKQLNRIREDGLEIPESLQGQKLTKGQASDIISGDKFEAPTSRQVTALEKHGVTVTASLSRSEAARMLFDLDAPKRIKKNLAQFGVRIDLDKVPLELAKEIYELVLDQLGGGDDDPPDEEELKNLIDDYCYAGALPSTTGKLEELIDRLDEKDREAMDREMEREERARKSGGKKGSKKKGGKKKGGDAGSTALGCLLLLGGLYACSKMQDAGII